MSRTPTPEVQITERIQPQAGLVDTYVRSPSPQPSPLHDVAQALSGFASDLDGYVKSGKEKQTEGDKLRAEKAFYDNNRMGYAEAVRTGVIPSNSSKDFVDAWKGAEGDHQGQELTRDLYTSYESEWAGKDSTNPEEFDAWFSGKAGGILKGLDNDPARLKQLLPHIRSIQQELHGRNSKEIADNTTKASIKAHIANATVGIDEMVTATGPEGEALTTKLWENILVQREAALGTGVRQEDFDKQLVDMINAKAVEHGDTDVLKLLDRKLPGASYAIKDDPQYRDSKLTAESTIADLRLRQELGAEKRQEKQDKEALGNLKAGIIDQLSKTPNKPIPEDILKAGTKLDPMFRVDMIDIQKKINDAGGSLEDKATIERIYKDISEGGGTDTVLQAIRYGVIKNPETIKEAMGYARSFTREGGSKLLSDPNYKRLLDTVKERTAPADWDKAFAPDGWTDEGLAAERFATTKLLEWEAANPDAAKDPLQVKKFVDGLTDTVLGDINKEERTYKGSPKNPQESQAEPPQTKTEAPPPEVQKPREPSPDMPKFETLSPQVQKRLREEADKRGADPQKLYQYLFETKKLNDEKQRKVVPEQHGSNNSVLPRSFRAVIDKHEGGGNYDTLFGHAQKKRGQFEGVRLSQMTVGEVLSFSRPGGAYAQSVKTKIGRVATPMGRHQIVGATLRKAVKAMGINLNTPFSPETQDRVALYLAKSRISGLRSMDDKIRALRSEWEGFKSAPTNKLVQIIRDLEVT